MSQSGFAAESSSQKSTNQKNQDSQTKQMRAAWDQRTITRLRQDNYLYQQKLNQTANDSSQLKLANNKLMKKVQELSGLLQKQKAKTKRLQDTIAVRVKRHEWQQQNSLSRGQKAILQRGVELMQAQLGAAKSQCDSWMKKFHKCAMDLQVQGRVKKEMQQHIEILVDRQRKNMLMVQELQKVYADKITLLEKQNVELNNQLQSVLLELSLHQRTQQIQALLYKQNNINYHRPSPSYYRAQQSQSLETFRENKTEDESLLWKQEAVKQQQLCELMRQKIQRIQSQLQQWKNRCSNLQSIICDQR